MPRAPTGPHASRSTTTLAPGAARLRVVKHFKSGAASRYELRAPGLQVGAEVLRTVATREPRQLVVQVHTGFRGKAGARKTWINFFGRAETPADPWTWRMQSQVSDRDLTWPDAARQKATPEQVLEQYGPFIDWLFALDAQHLPEGEYTVTDAPLHVFEGSARPNPRRPQPVAGLLTIRHEARGRSAELSVGSQVWRVKEYEVTRFWPVGDRVLAFSRHKEERVGRVEIHAEVAEIRPDESLRWQRWDPWAGYVPLRVGTVPAFVQRHATLFEWLREQLRTLQPLEGGHGYHVPDVREVGWRGLPRRVR